MPHSSSKPLPRTIEIQVADPATEEVFPTSLLDGIMRKIYNPVTLTYSLADAADLDAIISTTCAGLQTLMRDEYRFLAASVHEDPHTGHSFAKRTPAQSRFTIHVNDLRHTIPAFPSYAALAAAHFPVSALEDLRLLPPTFTPFPTPPADGSGIPVTLVQLNVIRGGLIIGLAINHRVVDARGLDAIVARWAAHTRALFDPANASPVPPFDRAALDREPLDWAARAVDGGGKRQEGQKSKVDWRDPAVPSMRCLPDGAPTGPGVKPEDMASRIWHVSASKLAALKARASGDHGDGAWVSTNDCLTALMWRCITRARLARHGIDVVSCVKDTRPVKLMNAIDVRAYVPTTPAPAATSSPSSPSSSFDSDDGGSGSGSGTEGSDSDSDAGRRSPTSSGGGNGIGIPDAYPGNTVMFSHATLPLNVLLSPSPTSLSPSSAPSSPDPAFRTIALAIRSAISYYRSPSTLRSALSWIASCPHRGVGTIEMDFDVVLGLDVVATSWRVLRAYERADFGWSSDGGLKALRWAAPLFDGYCFFYPTRKDGAGEDEGVEVYLGLERECMERLVRDPELAGWAEVRGE